MYAYTYILTENHPHLNDLNIKYSKFQHLQNCQRKLIKIALEHEP